MPLAWSPDGTAIATASTAPAGDGVVRVFDGRTGAPTGRFPGGPALEQNPVWAPGATRRGRRHGPGSSRGRCTARRRAVGTARSSRYGSRLLAWTVDGRLLAAGGRDHVVRVWRPGKADPVAEWSVSAWSMLLR